jgi:hypothetical protein
MNDVIGVKIPRSCLSRPGWVKYRALAESYKEETGLFLDPSNTDGPEVGPWSNGIKRS